VKNNDLLIHEIDPHLAKKICLSLATDLPEWFGIPEANERYALGCLERISLAARVNDNYFGMITLEFPYPKNANIYWMAVNKNLHRNKIGTKLIQSAVNYCLERKCHTITVETLSPKHNDPNYLLTYQFYEKCGFKPLFELRPYGPDHSMVYMQKVIALGNCSFVDLTHTLKMDTPTWNGSCGFEHQVKLDYTDCTTEVKFRVQQLKMHAGIGTHIDAPAHCFPDATTVSDIPIEQLTVPCVVIDVSDRVHERYTISLDDVKAFEEKYGTIESNTFVIFFTGWEKYWSNPDKYRNNLVFPNISKEAAAFLLERDIAGLGIDTLSPDRPECGFPVHQLILGAGKYIVENVANAQKIPPRGAYSLIFPIKIQACTESPVRLVGMILNDTHY
jgi:kynurenine formamidase/GNAT superfamily N-acetyltransferase